MPTYRLVIDASVARAAGGEGAEDPSSKACREFLNSVLEICHHLVFTKEVGSEWKRHRSKFARIWLRRMFARRKVEQVNVEPDDDLLTAIEVAETGALLRRAMEKDRHLLEAAYATDGVVSSLDEEARTAFGELSVTLRRLRAVVWINPTRAEEDPLGCLEGDIREQGNRLRVMRAEDDGL